MVSAQAPSPPPSWGRGLVLAAFRAAACVLRALPDRWIVRMGDALGDVVYAVDARGRRVARQNLQVAFGSRLTPQTRRAITRRSMRDAARAVLVLVHAAPLTEARIRRWVEVPIQAERRLRAFLRGGRAVFVSGHLGNWEALLGLASLFRDVAPLAFLVEGITHPVIDAILAELRGSGGARTIGRHGGARAMNAHLKRGGLVGVLADRNVRRAEGGLWAPFLGLPARTTRLPAWLARRHDVPLVAVFCLPRPDGRYRLEVGEELALDVRTEDADADVACITARVARAIERRVREHPEAWNWTLKRFKSRPARELGAYPAYSLFDP